VLNATGVLVATNLGRAPLSVAAVAAIVVADGTTDVELDLGTGRPGPGAPRWRSTTAPPPLPWSPRRSGRGASWWGSVVIGRLLGQIFATSRAGASPDWCRGWCISSGRA
jgi:hypothetical protein